MLKLLVCFLMLVSSALPARAEDTCKLVTDATLDTPCVVFYFRERRGLWFSEAKANELRRAWLLVPELQAQLAKHAEIDAIYDRELGTQRAIVESQRLELDKVSQALVVSESRADRFAHERDSWYRSPILWTAVGVALGLGVAELIMAAAR